MIPPDEETPTAERRPGAGPDTGASIEPGQRIGDYVVQALLASGGFGQVFRAEHAMLGRLAALKVLHADLAASSEAVARFEREARAVNLIRHPNVVDIYDFGSLPDGRPYFVMELLDGMDLQAHLRAHQRLSLAEALEILQPLCDALERAHDRGVIHRDIKASNVFLGAGALGGARRVVLLDFGIAKLLDGGSLDDTSSRHAVGTPACMAPEQIAGGKVDARTDVYGLGALVYHLLTGVVPFADETSTRAEALHLHAPRPRPSSKAPLPPEVDAVVMRAMAIAPEQRFARPGELYAALQAASDRRRLVTPG